MTEQEDEQEQKKNPGGISDHQRFNFISSLKEQLSVHPDPIPIPQRNRIRDQLKKKQTPHPADV